MTQAITMAILAMGLVGAPRAKGEVAQTQVRSQDEEAIKRTCLERIARFNRHEAPLPSAFTEDADFVNVYGMWRRGPAEIEARQKERMDTVLKEAQIKLLDLSIRFIRPDVAIVHQTHEMTGMLGADGKTMPPHRELGIRVLVKEQGKWLTTAFHNTIVRPAALPTRAPE